MAKMTPKNISPKKGTTAKKKTAKKAAPKADKKKQIARKSAELLNDAVQAIADQGHGIVIGTNEAHINIVIDDFTYTYDCEKPEESRLFVNGHEVTQSLERILIDVTAGGIPRMTLRLRPRPRRYEFDAKTGEMIKSYVLEKGQQKS